MDLFARMTCESVLTKNLIDDLTDNYKDTIRQTSKTIDYIAYRYNLK